MEQGEFRFIGWHAQFEFKLQDAWVGAFWKRIGNCIDLYICFLPFVPFHVSWWWSREPSGGLTQRAADGVCTCGPDAIGHSYDCPVGGNPLYNQPRR